MMYPRIRNMSGAEIIGMDIFHSRKTARTSIGRSETMPRNSNMSPISWAIMATCSRRFIPDNHLFNCFMLLWVSFQGEVLKSGVFKVYY